MGQQISRIPLEINEIPIEDSKTISSIDFNDDTTFFFPLSSLNDRIKESTIEKDYIQQIENYLYHLTQSTSIEKFHIQIKEKLIEPIQNFLNEQSNKISEETLNHSNYQTQLQQSLKTKLNDEKYFNSSIFNQSLLHNTEQLNYFAIQSLLSILLLLIKSVEKNDPLLIQQILTLTNQLSGQLPMKSLSNKPSILFQSLTPLINYITELSSSNDSNIFKQTIEILLSFSLAKGSLKDCLELIIKIIFNTTDLFNGEYFIKQINEYLMKIFDQNESKFKFEELDWISLNYLKSINIFPKIPENTLINGQLLSSILLSHIDIENEIQGTIKPINIKSFSYEFHPRTFQILFYLLEQLTIKTIISSNILQHIHFICLRLFTRHLQLLVDLQTSIHLNDYVSHDEQIKWLNLLIQLSNSNYSPSITRESSKALIYILQIQSISNKLIFIHQQIQNNQNSILIEEFYIELNYYKTLSDWIQSLNEQENKILTWPILQYFIDLYSQIEYQFRLQLENFLFSFQYHLLSKFINNNDEKFNSIIIEYITYILTKSINTNLFPSILVGLCFLTDNDRIFTKNIQLIFLDILPLISEYHLKHLHNNYHIFITYLINRISQLLILGLPEDDLEIQYIKQFQSPIFTGGYNFDKNDDLIQSKLARYIQFQLPMNSFNEKEFLLSIYHQINDGARLISKLKSFTKISQRPLPKSIEDQVNQACAKILAVYIKHYHRIPLAKAELLKDHSEPPSPYLLSLYEYANRIQTFFTVIKGQGGNIDELTQEIHNRTLFLLISIEENDFIPIINEYRLKTYVPKFHFQRQQSRWSKALHVIKLLRTLFQACLRFKKFMLEKKRLNDEKDDYESLFNRALEQFIYGNFAKISMSITNDDKQGSIEQLEHCLQRQYQRAIVRLIIYQFIEKFIRNLIEINENPSVYLPYLRKNELNWSYYNNIRNCNYYLRKSISTSVYSIIDLFLPYALQSEYSAQYLFYVLISSDQSIEYIQKILQILFQSFIQYDRSSLENKKSIYLQLIAFNWLRYNILNLCQSIENDQRRNLSNDISKEQLNFIYNTLIYNIIKILKENLSDISNEENLNSLKDISLAWFLHADDSNLPNHIYLDQYLVFILRTIRFYPYVLKICANLNYFQVFLELYQHISSNRTRLLLIKLFSYLIPSLPDSNNGLVRNLMENFLINCLKDIGENEISLEIFEELIDMYRLIISTNSIWQSFATKFIFDSIRSYLNIISIENNDTDKINQLIASLTILGAYIPSFRLGSIVKIDKNDEALLGLIIEIEEKDQKFQIQYFQSNHIESVRIDQLQHVNSILPPITDYSILDIFGEFIQIDSLNNDSLMFIQLKRRVISVLHHLLTKKDFIEIFMEKPYAKILGQLGFSNKLVTLPKDLRTFNQEHLEKYSLSLDRCQGTEDEEEIDENPLSTTSLTTESSSNFKINTPNPLITAALTSSSVNGWKAYASAMEIESFKKGRIAFEDISIVPLPANIVTPQAIIECGNKHQFRGRLAPNYDNAHVSFPTFIFDQFYLTEGKWYYCVRLPLAGVVQIGWATKGFTPSGGIGVGDDKYSWSYDGERGVLFWESGVYGQFDDIRWKADDVCGCGIEINGEQTNIKYWLNGKLLGTAFAHNKMIPLSFTKCDLLPNGLETSYYPAVTIQWSGDPTKYCDIIVSPEDMEQCPLPAGYKPLLLPKLVQTENTIVNYPFHAYLIGDQSDDFLLRTSNNSSSSILRDFRHNNHLSTTFKIDNHQLILSADSDGLLLSLSNDEISSLTINFDFELESVDNDSTDFLLIKFNSIEILWPKTKEKQQCAVVFHANEQQIKVYTNEKQRTIEHHELNKNFTICILPGSSTRLKNIAIWKYALPDEQICRLFTYGLLYLASEDQQLKEYRKHINRISFNKDQKAFMNELLLPFDQSFSTTIWEQKKKQIDEYESNYFKSHEDYSTIDLFGYQTYLVLNKSIEDWSNYTILLDFLIPQWPKSNEIITILTWNSQAILYIKHNGKLCLGEQQSSSTIEPNQSFRLCLSLHDELLQIHLNDKLEIELTVSDDQYNLKSNHIDLFKEENTTKNTIDSNTIRLSLQSITYFDRYVPIDQLQSPELTVPPLDIIMPYLTAMGYRKHWIELAREQNPSKDLSIILSEGKERFIEIDFEKDRQRCRNLFLQLNPSIKPEILDQILLSSKTDTPEHVLDLVQNLHPYLYTELSPSLSSSSSTMESDWFSKTVQDLNIPLKFSEWIRDTTKQTNKDEETIYSLFDINQTKSKISKQSPEYSHENLTSKQLLQTRLICEQALMIIYARSTLLNMLQTWSTNSLTRFPLEKFGDYSLLKFFLQDRSIHNEKNDRIISLIKSMLRTELKEFNNDRQSKTPLFDYLQKEITIQLLEFLIQPSWIIENINEKMSMNEQQQRPSYHFILQILQLFTELLSEKLLQIDAIIAHLFPSSLIQLIFNLFLLIPIHQSKISILHFFTTLLRISNQWTLNEHISQFFFQLLIELTSKTHSINENTLRKLQTSLTDLIFVLSRKENFFMKDYRSKFPKNLQNLFDLIDVIDIWNESNKDKTLPQAFFENSTNISLTDEEFRQSKLFFTRKVDQELVHMLNNRFSVSESFNELIERVPTGTEPDVIFYKNYPTLSQIPADAIAKRMKSIFLLTVFIEENLPVIDLGLPLGQSFLTDQIRTVKANILFLMKTAQFENSLQKTEVSDTGDWISVNFDTVAASTDNNNRSENTMFYQAYQQLHVNAHNIFRQSNEQLWRAQYLGMHSTDQGGPYRDSITRICADICSTRLPLFILCPNGRTNVGSNRDCWIPNIFPPNQSISIQIQKQYRFVGQLFGMAIRKKHYFDLKLPILFWKGLLQDEITVEDIEAIDIQSFRLINDMEKNIEQIQSMGIDQDMEAVFSSIMSELHFDVVSSAGQTYELIPGGSELPITAANFKDYCAAYRKYRLNEFNRQIELINQGLRSVIPSYYFSLFTALELEELVCGKADIDIELLKRNTSYGMAYSSHSQVITRFWTVLNEMFTLEQKKLFLIFVWGRSTLPSRDDEFTSRFIIEKLDVDHDEVNRALPRAHTCFFTIDLPPYSSTDIMYERLNYAITCCSSIDGDGNMNDMVDMAFLDSEENADES